jgi:5-hydroxyisourate hydrolase-like protein (transthyretin family)
VYGSRTTIVGQATGKKNTGATVTLLAKSAPAYTAVSTVATTRTDATGRYTFTIAPDRNTIYYVNVHTAPTATSGQVLVKVRVKITLHVSNVRPAAGARVRFSGFVMPAYNGRVVLIQRKTPRGWRTVARAKLGAATSTTTALGATTRSHYAKRVRVTSSGRYRVRFNPADALRIANNSPVRRLLVR